MKKKSNSLFLDELRKIAEGIGKTFTPFCEVVVHDLTHPKNAIVAIENNLSGRRLGQAATELGLARIRDPEYPGVITNYANQFADGRKVKSTSIGIKDDSGAYVAALCLNVDMTMLHGVQAALAQFARTEATNVAESLDASHPGDICEHIDRFAASRATTARALKPADRRQLIQELKMSGYFRIRAGKETAAAHMGVSRATVYSDLK